jgi:transposase
MNINNPTVTRGRVAVETAMTVKLGIDLHAADVVVGRQNDGALPRPSRRMRAEELVELCRELVAAGLRVYSCYEAGPCGYWLHRKLVELGVTNYVVVPRNLDSKGQRVKTDKRDARELTLALDRYVQGNTEAFTVIRVPSAEEEQRRSLGRQRGALLRERMRCVVRGHGLMLAQGLQAEALWWRPRQWNEVAAGLPGWLRVQVQDWQQQALRFDGLVERCSEAVLANAGEQILPKGVGELTTALLGMEVVDWHRFNNRRQVGSYTGLIPSEHSSGGRRRQGAITKHGNPRIRHLLLEAVWRLAHWQPAAEAVARGAGCACAQTGRGGCGPSPGDRFMAYPHRPGPARTARLDRALSA